MHISGAFSSGNYAPPEGYCFDSSCHYCQNDPIIDTEVSSAFYQLLLIFSFYPPN